VQYSASASKWTINLAGKTNAHHLYPLRRPGIPALLAAASLGFIGFIRWWRPLSLYLYILQICGFISHNVSSKLDVVWCSHRTKMLEPTGHPPPGVYLRYNILHHHHHHHHCARPCILVVDPVTPPKPMPPNNESNNNNNLITTTLHSKRYCWPFCLL
jgi:hypothetical protein